MRRKKKLTIDLDWESFAEFLIGRCRMSIRDAMRVTVYEYRHMREAAEKDDERMWEVVRWAVFHLVWAIPGKHTNTARTPKRMFPMPWDDDTPAVPHMTADEEQEVLNIFREYKARHKI